MQDKETHKIDGIFRSGLTQLPEEAPSLSGWEKMREEMKKEGIKIEEEKKGNKFLWLSIFSFITIIAGALAYNYMGNNTVKENEHSETEKTTPIATTTDIELKNEIPNSGDLKEDNNKKETENKTTEKTPETKKDLNSPIAAGANLNNAVEEKDKLKSKHSSLLSVYSIRVATFGGQVNDPELNAIPNLKSEYFPKDDVTVFFIGGYKNKEEAISGMKRIQKEFNSRIDPGDAASQKNLKDAYDLFEEELNKL